MLGAAAPPIGLIHSAVGGTMIEAWAPNGSLAGCRVAPPSRCSGPTEQV